MARHETRKVGEGGNVVIPASFREEHGIEPGDIVEFEDREDGILLRGVEKKQAKGKRREH